MTRLSFTVLGTPISQGNKTGYVRGGRVVLVEGRRPKARAAFHAWRNHVAEEARRALEGQPPYEGPVNLNLVFRMPRPKSHYRTGKHHDQLRPNAPVFCPTRPDIEKLARSISDSLTTAGVWKDDSQVATLHARKIYGNDPDLIGCDIVVQPLPEGEA